MSLQVRIKYQKNKRKLARDSDLYSGKPNVAHALTYRKRRKKIKKTSYLIQGSQ